jgi:DNA-binding response OmpR family regulator
MYTILLVGADEVLLSTRAAVLSKTDSEVVCSNADSALAIQADRECDLVMLCHSLPDEVCTSLAETIRKVWPKTRTLLIQTQREWRQVDIEATVDGTSSTEPEQLIGKTVELLSHQMLSGAGDVCVRGGIVRGGPFA